MLSLPSPFANIKGSVAGWAMLATLGAGLAIFCNNRFEDLRHLRVQQVKLENHLFEQQATNRATREMIRKLESDPVLIERIARERLGLVRPGEIIYFAQPDLVAAHAP